MSQYDEILDFVPVGQLAGQYGVSENEVREAATQALPALLGGLQANAADPIRARVSLATSQAHPYYPGAVRFKEVLEAESKGAIQVQIFTDAQAGDEAASLQLIRSGGLQFAEHSSSLSASASNEPAMACAAKDFPLAGSPQQRTSAEGSSYEAARWKWRKASSRRASCSALSSSGATEAIEATLALTTAR